MLKLVGLKKKKHIHYPFADEMQKICILFKMQNNIQSNRSISAFAFITKILLNNLVCDFSGGWYKRVIVTGLQQKEIN